MGVRPPGEIPRRRLGRAPARVTADMAGPVALGDEGPVVADGEHLAAAGQRVDEPVRLRLEVSKTPFEKPFQPARLKR